MPITATNIRRGMAIMFEGEPCRVIEFHHHPPGNLRAMVHAKLRKLKTGVTVEHRFRASDTVEEAQLETHELQYLYHDGHSYHFMNTQTYEQYEIDEESLGDHSQWMTDGNGRREIPHLFRTARRSADRKSTRLNSSH